MLLEKAKAKAKAKAKVKVKVKAKALMAEMEFSAEIRAHNLIITTLH